MLFFLLKFFGGVLTLIFFGCFEENIPTIFEIIPFLGLADGFMLTAASSFLNIFFFFFSNCSAADNDDLLLSGSTTFPSFILSTSNLESGLVASEITTTFVFDLASISLSRILLSLRSKEDISGDTIALTSLVFCLLVSSSISLKTEVDKVFTS